ncbi:hypothetical protein OWV82_006600 [Melia azedarach]|uniref:Uncharacterized protein n=1 Tax=Melia azedarach TaxID=155640 RepID=A0ACC1YHD5_MELAZ|nr:hypothetical protein OWV82_006600 [Melia azedarach]
MASKDIEGGSVSEIVHEERGRAKSTGKASKERTVSKEMVTSFEARLAKLELSLGDIHERLNALDDQVGDRETDAVAAVIEGRLQQTFDTFAESMRQAMDEFKEMVTERVLPFCRFLAASLAVSRSQRRSTIDLSTSLVPHWILSPETLEDMSDTGESEHSPADSEAATLGNVASFPISLSRTKRYKVRVGRGHSNVIGESSEEGVDQSFFLDDERTSITAEMVAQLRKAYDIPSSRKWTCDLSCDTDIKDVREYVVTNLSETDIVTEERLAKVGLIPPPSSGWPRPARTPSQRAVKGFDGSDKSVATSSGLPPRPKRAKKVEGPGWTPQLAVDLGGILSGHFAHASPALPTLKQVLEFLDSEKGSKVASLNPNQVIDMTSHLFLQFGDKLKEGSTSTSRVAKLEAQLSRLSQKVKDKDDQISKLEDWLGEVRDKVGLMKSQLQAQVDRANELQASVDKLEIEADALVAKFGKDQNPVDAAGSSRQLTSGYPLNLEVSPPHSDQEEDDSEDQDDKGSQSGKGDDA